MHMELISKLEENKMIVRRQSEVHFKTNLLTVVNIYTFVMQVFICGCIIQYMHTSIYLCLQDSMLLLFFLCLHKYLKRERKDKCASLK